MTPIRLLPAVLAATAIAQITDTQPATRPATQPGDPVAQEVVRPETPAERAAKLQQQIGKLRQELKAIQDLEATGGLPGRVREFLKERAISAEILTTSQPAGPVAPAQPQAANPGGISDGTPVARRGARLLGDAEKAGLAADVIFVVDGQAATKAEFDALYDYVKSYPSGESDETQKTRVVLELTRIKAAQAAFRNTVRDAHSKIVAAQRRLKETGDFGAVAKEYSECPTAAQGGDLGMFGRDGMDLQMCRAAFGMRVGETSDVVATDQGYVIVKVTGGEKGDTPANDKVKASRILRLYTPEVQALRDVQMKVNGGQVDLAFVSDEYRKYTPQGFR